jgi:hypothetical protein
LHKYEEICFMILGKIGSTNKLGEKGIKELILLH